MLKRKSQIHMLETIAVLAIFFILATLGFVFYSKVLKGSVESEKEEIVQLSAIEIAQRASFLPELQCSQENIVKDNCIDLLKLDAAKEIMKNNEIFYFDKFSFSSIKINEMYPNEQEWVLYERPLEDYSNKILTNIPISLFDPVQNRNNFGVMSIELFLK